MSQSLDYSGLESALLFVEAATGRSMPESLNRAALHVIIGSGAGPGAMQATPKADKGKIASVSDAQLRGFVIQRAKRTGKWPLKPGEIQELVKKERRRRRRAIGYTAYAGWNNAAKAMGGRGAGGKTRIQGGFERSEAAHGSGLKATPVNLLAEIINTAPAAEQIGFEGIQTGINNAAQDLVDYGTRKIQQAMTAVQP